MMNKGNEGEAVKVSAHERTNSQIDMIVIINVKAGAGAAAVPPSGVGRRRNLPARQTAWRCFSFGHPHLSLYSPHSPRHSFHLRTGYTVKMIQLKVCERFY